GLAEVNGSTVTPIAAPAGVKFGDVIALAKLPDGKFLALDADQGLFVVDVDAHATKRWSKRAWVTPERAVSLAVDGAGRVAGCATRGILVYGADGGATRVSTPAFTGRGGAMVFRDDGQLYAGTDQSLVRIAVGDAELPVLGPSGMLPRDLYPVDVG